MRQYTIDRQLSRNIKKLKTTYTDSFETAENRKRADEMWETGKIPMEVNTMTRIIVYELKVARVESLIPYFTKIYPTSYVLSTHKKVFLKLRYKISVL